MTASTTGETAKRPAAPGAGAAYRLPEVGERLDKYLILGELGRGGQGTVFLAEDTDLGRKVALKVLDGWGATSTEVWTRFRREALTASKLQHPGICAIYEAKTDAVIPFIAMQYVDGQTLARRIAITKERTAGGATATMEPAPSVWLDFGGETTSQVGAEPSAPTQESAPAVVGPLERDAIFDVVALFEKAARALAAAHEAGVVHRDVKPGNIMVAKTGDPVLLDFGLARRDDPDMETMTEIGEICGTPAYMSPEQLARQSIKIDARTDVWSLGVALYESLVMRRPFESPTREGLYLAILNTEPVSPRKMNRRVPEDLAVVVLTALEKSRDRRYQTALDFAEDLRRVRMKEPIAARPVGPIGRILRWASREPAKAALAAVLLLTAPTIVGLVTAWVKDRPAVLAARRLAWQDAKEAMLADASWELLEGDPAKALPIYEQILDKDPDAAEARAARILAHLRQKNFDTVEALLTKDASTLPAGFGVACLRADLLRGRGRADEAGDILTNAPAPRSLFDHWIATKRAFFVGEDLERSGRHAAAIVEFRRAYDSATQAMVLARAPRLDLAVMRAHAAGHIADPELSHGAADMLDAHWPDVPEAAYWIGFIGLELVSHADRERAIAALRRYVERRPENPAGWGNLGAILAIAGRRDEARTAFEESLRRDSSDADILRNYGILLSHTDKDAAVERLREARKLAPTNARVLATLGEILAELGRGDEAIVVLEEAHAAAPDDVNAAAVLGRILVESGKSERAIEVLEGVVKNNPDASAARLELGSVYRSTGATDLALETLQKLVADRPTMPEALCNLASLLEIYGRWPEALELYRRGHAIGSRLADWSYPSAEWVAKAEVEAGRVERTATALDRYLASDTEPDDAEELLRGARLLAIRDRAAKATEWFAAAFEENPGLGADLRTRDRLFAAEAAVRASIETDGKRAAENRRLAREWLEKDIRAIDAAMRADRPPIQAVRGILRRYLTSRSLAPIRGDAIAALPEDERAAFRAFWADVDRIFSDR